LRVPGLPLAAQTPAAPGPEGESAKRDDRQRQPDEIGKSSPNFQERHRQGAEYRLNPIDDRIHTGELAKTVATLLPGGTDERKSFPRCVVFSTAARHAEDLHPVIPSSHQCRVCCQWRFRPWRGRARRPGRLPCAAAYNDFTASTTACGVMPSFSITFPPGALR